MSSWWAAIHGYRHPVLDAAVRDQLGADEPRHVRRAHPRARRRAGAAARRDHPGRAASTSSSPTPGSVSVEVAIKMCLQYWRSRGRPGKQRLLTWRGGYHGDTFGSRCPCATPTAGCTRCGAACCPGRCSPTRRRRRSSRPTSSELAELRRAARRRAGRGDRRAGRAGRGRDAVPRPALPARAARAAPTHDVLLVFDEIATGFGRTGELFAADHAGVAPGRDVRRQGADRRLPDDGGDAVHAGGGRGISAARPGARARADVHGQPAGRGGRRGPRSGCCSTGTGGPRSRDRGGAAGRAGAGARTAGRAGRARARRDRRGAARPRGGHGRPRPRRPSTAGCGCGRSATSSTRCRPTSAMTTTWPRSPPPCAAAAANKKKKSGGRAGSRARPPVTVSSGSADAPPISPFSRLLPAGLAGGDAAAAPGGRVAPGAAVPLRRATPLLDVAGNDYLGLAWRPPGDRGRGGRGPHLGRGLHRLPGGHRRYRAARRAGGRAGRVRWYRGGAGLLLRLRGQPRRRSPRCPGRER